MHFQILYVIKSFNHLQALGLHVYLLLVHLLFFYDEKVEHT